MTYQLSVAAEEDIINIFVVGAAEFGMYQAERYHAKLETCFEFLAKNPKAAPLRLEITPPVRVHPIGAHIVIYVCYDDNSVMILRIRHGHEDWL